MTSECTLARCLNRVYAKQICRNHYYEMRHGGDWIRNILNNDYASGAGKIMCEYCHEPVRDHEMRPCPTSGTDLLLTGEGVSDDGLRRRRYRKKSGR